MNSGFESRWVWDLPWILDSLQTILQFKAEIKMAPGSCMAIPECLPWQTYQGDSESLNPFVLLPSCKYSCQKVNIHVWVMAMRFWCISLPIVGPKQGQDCKKHKWRIGIGRKGYTIQKGWEKNAVTHACCLSGSFLKGVVLVLVTV